MNLINMKKINYFDELGRAGGGGAGAEHDGFDMDDKLLWIETRQKKIISYAMKIPTSQFVTNDIGGGGGGGFGTLEFVSANSVFACVI